MARRHRPRDGRPGLAWIRRWTPRAALELAIDGERRGHAYYSDHLRHHAPTAELRAIASDSSPQKRNPSMWPATGTVACRLLENPDVKRAGFLRPLRACFLHRGQSRAAASLAPREPKRCRPAASCGHRLHRRRAVRTPRSCVMPSSYPSHDQRSHVELITVYEIGRILGASLDIEPHLPRRAQRAGGAPRAAARDDRDARRHERRKTRSHVHSSVGLSREQEQRGHWSPAAKVSSATVFADRHAGGRARRGSLAPEFIDRTGAFSATEAASMMAFVVVPLKTDKAVVGVLAAQRELVEARGPPDGRPAPASRWWPRCWRRPPQLHDGGRATSTIGFSRKPRGCRRRCSRKPRGRFRRWTT